MLLHEKYVNQISDRIINQLQKGTSPPSVPPIQQNTEPDMGPVDAREGIFTNVDDAVAAAKRAAAALQGLAFDTRGRIVKAIRKMVISKAEYFSRLAVEETGMGRVEDKIGKNILAAEKTPGVEHLSTQAFSSDKGLTLEEFAPFGVIGAIIPSTNPTETAVNNGISMFVAGNAVVFNAHPNAKTCTNRMIAMMNRAVVENGGPANCFAALEQPTLKTAGAIMHHPDIALLVVTGAAGVVRAALATQKKVVAGGPGNPPALVDETADIANAARNIVMGASLDNNIICVDEKVTVVVDSVADQLVREMEQAGAYLASANQVRSLEAELFQDRPQFGKNSPVKREYVGKDAGLLLAGIGARPGHDLRLIVCEVDPDHPFAWSEMLMPLMPVVRMKNVDSAIDYAVSVERGCRHTASMYSRNIDKLMKMARHINTSLFVKNAANVAGMGLGGEGYTSFTIASPTGDGLTTARTFSRRRRCALVGPYGVVAG